MPEYPPYVRDQRFQPQETPAGNDRHEDECPAGRDAHERGRDSGEVDTQQVGQMDRERQRRWV